MAEVPKAAPSVYYNKEMEEEENNKETKAQRQVQLPLPSGPAFSEGGNPKAPVGNRLRCGKPGQWD